MAEDAFQWKQGIKQNYFSSYSLKSLFEQQCRSSCAPLGFAGEGSSAPVTNNSSKPITAHLCWLLLLFLKPYLRSFTLSTDEDERETEWECCTRYGELAARKDFFFSWNFKYALQIQYSSQPKKIWMKNVLLFKKTVYNQYWTWHLHCLTHAPPKHTHLFLVPF